MKEGLADKIKTGVVIGISSLLLAGCASNTSVKFNFPLNNYVAEESRMTKEEARKITNYLVNQAEEKNNYYPRWNDIKEPVYPLIIWY